MLIGTWSGKKRSGRDDADEQVHKGVMGTCSRWLRRRCWFGFAVAGVVLGVVGVDDVDGVDDGHDDRNEKDRASGYHRITRMYHFM